MISVLHLMRVTLEATTPLTIGSGEQFKSPSTGDTQADEDARYWIADVVRDANGLPTLPGPSVQGVLRNLFASENPVRDVEALFGWARGDKGETGRLTVGWGAIHDRNDTAVVGQLPANAPADPILEALLAKDDRPHRDHVALNERHVVDGRQKFARAFVPRGARFSIEFSLWGEKDQAPRDRDRLIQVARLFTHPAFRLGGSSGRGYGRVDLKGASYASPDLAAPRALRILREQPPSNDFDDDLKRDAAWDDYGDVVTTASLTLTPCNPWRVGGRSGPSMTEDTCGARGRDGPVPEPGMSQRLHQDDVQLIVREPVIAWNGGRGDWVSLGAAVPWVFPIPGSAIKGPLAHRALYHFNLRRPESRVDTDVWLTDPDKGEARLKNASRRPTELEALFGAAKEKIDKGGGRAGRLLVADGVVEGVDFVQAVDHVSIDRFTGGARDQTGALYAEEVLVGGHLAIELTLLSPFQPARTPTRWEDCVVDTFLDALADLCHERLAIGAKSLGFCRGRVEWRGPAKEAWEARWAPRIEP